MTERHPVAFLSYVRSDDEHDGGKISQFRIRLEGEVKMQTGQSFEIFQDRNDLKWGQNWEERIKSSLTDVTFLIPIITPSFFSSPACRYEFETFLRREQTLGSNRLILPLYYVTADELNNGQSKDSIASVLRQRQWTDWRAFRFRSFADEDVASSLASMAETIKSSMQELNSIDDASQSKSITSAGPIDQESEPLAIEPVSARVAARPKSSALDLGYEILEARPKGAFDAARYKEVLLQPYYVYTRQYDEVLAAKEYASAGELLELFRVLGNKSARLEKRHKKKIGVLTEALMADRKKTDLAITLLLDNSGSMRGAPIGNLAAWTYVVMGVLSQLAIPTEVLGYTTRAWRGGQSRDLWLADGSPAMPGRLNDLRHIIYKAFSDNFGDSYPNLGLMMREGILKENIDGEALLWASARLQHLETSRRILFVLTDGASIDDSTISANSKSKTDQSGSNFLHRHLRQTASLISKQNIELKVVGIDHANRGDLSSYYPETVSVGSGEALGITILEILSNDL